MKQYTKPKLVFTGVGNRDAPKKALWIGEQIAKLLFANGYTLRSGGADGMDETFYNGCVDRCEIYPPWNGFSGFHLNYPVPETAFQLAAEILTPSIFHHPNKSQGYHLLHARNMQEVLGPFCEPQHKSDLLICYTRDGCTGKHNRTKYTGGTASAILCAQKFDVPCINLFNESWSHELQDHTECDFKQIHEEAFRIFY